MFGEVVIPGEGKPVYDNAPQSYTPELYANIAAVLRDGLDGGLKPALGARTDGEYLFYRGAVNCIVGAPESGKTLLSLSVLANEIFEKRGVLVIDIDHNGARAITERLRSLAISEAQLSDINLFRYSSPETPEELLQVIAEAQIWKPSAVLVDSVGEVLSMFGAKSNDEDQVRAVHRKVFAPLAIPETAVISLDHEPKSEERANYGASGSYAKKSVIDGALYRIKVTKPFIKGEGGKAVLSILKDRHGAVREISERGVKEARAATFHLITNAAGATDWKFYPPDSSESSVISKALADVELLKKLSPVPNSQRKAVEAVKTLGQHWSKERAGRALKLLQESEIQDSVPVLPLEGGETRTTLTPVPEGHIRTDEGQGQFGSEA